jgi:hypothetical protein
VPHHFFTFFFHTCFVRIAHENWLTSRLWYNGAPALNFTNLEIRSSDTLASIGGLYFSTFFGGDDVTWATPSDQYSYYKNMAVYAGQGAATGKGEKSGAAKIGLHAWSGLGMVVVALVMGLIM